MEEEDVEVIEFETEAVDEGYEMPYQGEILISWMVDEYIAHERGPVWYGAAATIGFGLLIYAIIAQNFLFAVIIVMFGVVIGLTTLRHPDKVPFVVTDLGIGIGSRFTPFKELKSFAIVYEPPEVKTLYIEYRNHILPHLIIPLDEQDPLELRGTLGRFLREDLTKEEEPFMEWLGRLLKI